MPFILFALWIIFNGRLAMETTLLGIVISLMLFMFACRYMGYSPDTDKKMLRFLLRGLRYAAILVWETTKSNLYVSKIVYSRKISVQPQMVFFRTKLKTTAARVALANSITLTPGTLTVVLTDDLFCVHCLNSDFAVNIDKSVFVKQLEKFENQAPDMNKGNGG